MSALVVSQSSSEIPEGLMNNPVFAVDLTSATDELILIPRNDQDQISRMLFCFFPKLPCADSDTIQIQIAHEYPLYFLDY